MRWLAVLLLCGTAAAQSEPAFEAASVRPFDRMSGVNCSQIFRIEAVTNHNSTSMKETPLEDNDKPYVSGIVLPKPVGATEVISHRATIDDLADKLALFLHEPVWNRKGLTGNYDYAFRYGVGDDPAVEAPSLEYALRNTLGITLLKRQTGPVEFLVVDSMETDPGEN